MICMQFARKNKHPGRGDARDETMDTYYYSPAPKMPQPTAAALQDASMMAPMT